MQPDDDDTPIYQQLARERLFELDPPGEPGAEPAPDIPENIPADAPADDHDAGIGGHLGTVTDVEWFAAHHRLIADAPDLAPELDYIWDPSTEGRKLVELTTAPDIAPPAGRYDPNTDERFHGGGFRG